MIASVRGAVAAVTAESAVVEVAGVGLVVQCPPPTLARLRVGEVVRLATSLVVREDSLSLYGFADDAERELFELLQTASGVGPKLALAVLGVLAPARARQALREGDVRTLTLVPGIGKKGAERMILELRDRVAAGDGGIAAVTVAAPDRVTSAAQPWREQVGQALVGLGWSAREADEAVAGLAAEAEAGADVPSLLRSALRALGRA